MTELNKPAPRRSTGKRNAGVAAAVAGILGAVFALEGGYVNHPNDPGGETNHGITVQVARDAGYQGTMRALKRYCDLEIDENGGAPDPREICAQTILFQNYIVKPGFLPLVVRDPVVAEEVIDTAVNMGPARPSRYLQRALNEVCDAGLIVDGKIGDRTHFAFGWCMAQLGRPVACRAILRSLDRQQREEYDRLVRVNPRLRVFHRGWINHRIGNVDPARCAQGSV